MQLGGRNPSKGEHLISKKSAQGLADIVGTYTIFDGKQKLSGTDQRQIWKAETTPSKQEGRTICTWNSTWNQKEVNDQL